MVKNGSLESMIKIFITEFEKDNEIYAGPNIYAVDWETAEEAALAVGCTVVGELSDIMIYDTNTEVTIH